MRNLADCTADMGSFLSAAASFYNVMDRVAVLLDIRVDLCGRRTF